MVERLIGKVCLVANAFDPIGAAISQAFEEEGAVVIRDTTLGEHPETRWLQALNDIESKYNRLDVVMNGCTGLVPNSIESIEIHEFEELFLRNVECQWLGMKEAIPYLRRTSRGCIINTATLSSVSGAKHNLAYLTCAGAVASMTRSAALEVSDPKKLVRINAIIHSVRSWQVEGTQSSETGPSIESVACGTARAAVFLASDESSYLTGATIEVAV